MVWDVTQPAMAPRFVQYLDNRDFAGVPDRPAPPATSARKASLFIPKKDSPTPRAAPRASRNEISGTTTLYRHRPRAIAPCCSLTRAAALAYAPVR